MKVKVILYSDFRKFLPESSERDGIITETDDSISVGGLLDQLKIPADKPKLITVNDTNRKSDHILNDQDVVKVFPLARGG